MNPLFRAALVIAALDGLLAVGIGAFAAHGLKATATAYQLGLIETGSLYQMVHAAAAVAALWLVDRGRLSVAAPLALALGALIFAGALYSIALADLSLGMVAPVGGTMMLIGWAWILVTTLFRG
ncbi:DUF423 domain-containing protein [Zavarzinia compransoris]|uniref:DUF423 domain-containing protein n=1 Tax=Zavarzinia marina TaxID=2911065 RepID=UPI001F42519F|nr:DUF423 domain-containing protein [Zavarzinia marina]MCF4164261.1 DUF423 domain-containing protein [Zavarzinia marina]